MPRLRTSVGQLMINEVLPEDMRDYDRVLDKKGVTELMRELAEKHPDQYREVSHALSNIGWHASYTTGGNSFGLRHMQMLPSSKLARDKLRAQLQKIYDDDELSDEEREKKILLAVGRLAKEQQKQIFDEAVASGNPLARQVLSGAKGSKMNLASLLGSDLLYTDHRGRPLPIPVLRSYSQGLRPVEYWAGSYGARKGVIDLKFCIFSEEKVLMADYSEKPIGEVRRGEWVMGANRKGEMFPVRVIARHDNGDRPCYRYRFRKGSSRKTSAFRELVATEEHKILAQVKAGRPGSTYAHRSVYEPTLLPLGSARLQKNPTKNEFVAYPSRGETGCLDRVDEPRALLAGLMVGDGCMAPSCHGSYSFSCADPVLLSDVREYLAGFNLKLSRLSEGSYNYSLAEISPSKRRTRVIAGHNSFVPGHHNETKAWLKYYLGEKLSHEKTVPEEVWTWNDSSVGAFLGGVLSSDACVHKRKDGCTIKLRMASCAVVTQVQRLLELRLGIWTGSFRRAPKEQFRNAKHDQYEITINHPECVRRFAARVPLVGCKRQELVEAVEYESKDPASREIGFKIHSREFVGARETCDLEVDHPEHMFVLANGLIVANSTQEAGFLSKQLNQIAHRALVTGLDADKEPDTLRGLPVETNDPDNEGALLAYAVGPYKRNTILTPKILSDLRKRGIQRLLVRSPAVSGDPEGGVYARDVGVREFGRLPVSGENVGLTAAQALCLSEGTLVQMANGKQKPIEDVNAGEQVLGCSLDGVLRPVEVLARYDNGEQECVRTVFRRGTGQSCGLNLLEMVSTGSHKILSEVVMRSGNAAKRLPYFSPIAIRPVATEIPEEKQRGGDRFCAKLASSFDDTGCDSQPYAMLLGLLLGDGCYSGSSSSVIGFSCYDSLLAADIREHVKPLGFELNNNTENEYRVVDSTRREVKHRDDGTWFRNRLQELLRVEGMWGQTSYTKTLPEAVHLWDNKSIASLISGCLVTDGYVIAAGGLGFSSSSYAMLYGIRQLLGLRFGVWGSNIIPKKKKPNGGDYRPCFCFTINRREDVSLLQQVLPVAGVKWGRLQDLLSRWYAVERPAKNAVRVKGRCSRISQEAVGSRRTYDLYVAHPDHLFVLANGLVVSNSEPLTQAQISSKHTGGVAGAGAEAAISGFDRINQLIQTPKAFKGGAAHANKDGLVQFIEDAPAGGKYVTIDNEKHYVGDGFDLKVKKGDHVEAGDVISEGIPNPSTIVHYKGVGEGRRYFVKTLHQAFDDAGIAKKTGTRRNIEILARGLINHVRLTDEVGDFAPDDVVPYSLLEHRYRPRADALSLPAKRAVGQYLEKPYLHYSIGTQVKPSMLRDFQDFGIKEVVAHPEAPPFQPEMIRGMANLQHDPDWLTRMFGSGLKTSLLKGVHRGGHSTAMGTSFVPALANPITFGQTGKVVTPKVQDDQDRAQQEFKVVAAAAPVTSQDAERQAILDNIAARLYERQRAYMQAEEQFGDWVAGRTPEELRASGGRAAGDPGNPMLRGGVTGAATGLSLLSNASAFIPFVSGGQEGFGGDYPYYPAPVGGSISPEYQPFFGDWYARHGRKALEDAGAGGYEQSVISPEEAKALGLPPGMHTAESLQKHLGDDWNQAWGRFYTPSRAWRSLTPEQRRAEAAQFYGEGYAPTNAAGSFNEDEPNALWRSMYPDFYGEQEAAGPLTYNSGMLSDVRDRYRSDPAYTAKLDALPEPARQELFSAQSGVMAQLRNNEITPEQAQQSLEQLHSTVMAVDPASAAYHFRRANPLGAGSDPAEVQPYDFSGMGQPDPQDPMGELGLMIDTMMNDSQIANNIRGGDGSRIFMDKMRSLEERVNSGQLTQAEAKQELTRIAGVLKNSDPANAGRALAEMDADQTPLGEIPHYQPQVAEEQIAEQVRPTTAAPPVRQPQQPAAPPAPQQSPPVVPQNPAADQITDQNRPATAAPPVQAPQTAQPQQPVAQAPQPKPPGPAISPQFMPPNRGGVPYKPGQGFLPMAQMMNQFMPGSIEQTFQTLGPAAPLAWGALFDTGAVSTLTGMGGGKPKQPKAPALPKLPKPPVAKPQKPMKPLEPAKPAGGTG